MSVAWCDTCHRAIGVGCACGLSYREKSVQLHPNATPSREKRNYFDREALHQTFGEDARERVMERTNGRGLNGPVPMSELFD